MAKKRPDRRPRTHEHADLSAHVKKWDEADLIDHIEKLQEPALLLLLDTVQDPQNLGACLRSAAVDPIFCRSTNQRSLLTVRK